MKKLSLLFIIICILSVCFAACNDGNSSIGNSLVGDKSEVIIDSTFTLSGHSVRDISVQSKTTTQLLGRLSASEFGSLSSDFVTQFMPAAKIDTAGVSINDIDSVKMLMFYTPGAFTGDSLMPMGFKVYPLTRQLQTPIYSDFDPAGYYDEANCWTPQNQIYTANAIYNDSINKLSYRTIYVKLPIEFGRKLYREYINNPSTFSTPSAFARFFPGLYVKNTFGSGRVTNITQTRINLYYRKHAKYTVNNTVKDTIYYNVSAYLGVTPEIITNNIISLDMSGSLQAMADNGKTLLVAPTGYNARVVFPAQEIINRYKAQAGDMAVINTLSMIIPVEEITNDYSIKPPANILFVLSSKRKEFFEENSINDDKTSFLATYDATNHRYAFTNLRPYILQMLNKSSLTADDVTFDIVPVDITSETTSDYYGNPTVYVTGINPLVSGPAMCSLKLNETKIRFTYSKQSINN